MESGGLSLESPAWRRSYTAWMIRISVALMASITVTACKQHAPTESRAASATATNATSASDDRGAMTLDPDKMRKKPPGWPPSIPPLPARPPCQTSCDLSTDAAVAARLHLTAGDLPWVDRPAPGIVLVGAAATDLARVTDEVFIDCCQIGGRFDDDSRFAKIAQALGWDHADARGREAIAWVLVNDFEQLEVLDTAYRSDTDPFPDRHQLHDPIATPLPDGGVELEVWYHSIGLGKFVHARIRVDAALKQTDEKLGTLPSTLGPI
jgi:hypothetical protein